MFARHECVPCLNIYYLLPVFKVSCENVKIDKKKLENHVTRSVVKILKLSMISLFKLTLP